MKSCGGTEPCPVCGSSGRGWLPGLLKCRACGLVFRTEKYFGGPGYRGEQRDAVYVYAKEALFASALDYIGAALAGPGRLLDVGCAGGELLRAAAARGWKGEGVELDPGLADRASASGFPVFRRPVERAGLGGNSYDAATAFEVFSQMGDPAAAAGELYRLLRPSGLLYVREFNSVFHMPLCRLEASGLLRPLGVRPSVLHNFNFGPGSLRVMLEKAGFREIKFRNSPPTAGDPYRSGGRLGGVLTARLKVLYYWLAQALWAVSFGRVLAGSALIVTARK